VHEGGSVSISASAVYRKVWNAGLQLTYYFGSVEFQPLKDRGFVSLNVQRTF